MTAVQNPVVVMKRFESKYILTPEKEKYFRERMSRYMYPDSFGLTSIASLYYDTPDYRLITRSLEKPLFKEKIRLRSYGLADSESPVFLELKRKAYGIVYKRRVRTTVPLARKFFEREGDICGGGQINHELTYFRDFYRDLAPACLIICDREAFFRPDSDLRLTIDANPRYRIDGLDLRISMDGEPLLPEGYSILEIKVQDAVPLWLSGILSEGEIYETGFSKYGEAYRRQVMKIKRVLNEGERRYV